MAKKKKSSSKKSKKSGKKGNSSKSVATKDTDEFDDIDQALDALLDSYSKGGIEVGLATYESIADARFCTTTGSPHLDYVLGGGIYSGRMYEVYGEPGNAKTSIMQGMMCGVQRSGGLSGLIDAEVTWNRKRAKAMGYNLKRHVHAYPDYLEEAFTCVEDLAYILRGYEDSVSSKLKKIIDLDALKVTAEHFQDKPILFAFDTIASCPSFNAYDNPDKRYAGGMAERPKLIHEGMRRLVMPLAKLDVALVLVNQTISKMGRFTSGTTTPGGGGTKFYPSARMSVKKGDDLVISGEGHVGFLAKVNPVKNRFAPPFRPVEVPLRFTSGIDPAYDLFYWLLLEPNRFSEIFAVSSGGNYSFCLDGQEYGFKGKANFGKYCKEVPEFLPILEMEVMRIAMSASFGQLLSEQELDDYEDYEDEDLVA